MALTILHQPGESAQDAQKVLCNGEATGRQCVHYWAIRAKAEAINTERVKKGKKYRFCTLNKTAFDDLGSKNLATECNMYRPKGFWFQLAGRYDAAFEAPLGVTPPHDSFLRRLFGFKPQTVPLFVSSAPLPLPSSPMVSAHRADFNNDAPAGADGPPDVAAHGGAATLDDLNPNPPLNAVYPSPKPEEYRDAQIQAAIQKENE